MAGRRGCMNSLWSGTERVRIGERLKATVAGVLELELLRCKHMGMITAVLEHGPSSGTVEPLLMEERENRESNVLDPDQGSATSRRQQAPSPSDIMVPPCSPVDGEGNPTEGSAQSRNSGGGDSRWSTLSWDAPSDLLSPPTPDPCGTAQMDSDSRPSSGFYSVSGSSLSDSCFSVSSEVALGVTAPPPPPLVRPLKLWDQVPVAGDHSDTQWPDTAMQQQTQPAVQSSQEDSNEKERRSDDAVPGGLEETGLNFLSDLCSNLGYLHPSSIVSLLRPTAASSSSTCSLQPKPQLDPRYCTDLVSRRTKEVYPYPSPLHAVALQSPLFTCHSPEPSASAGLDGLDGPDEASAWPASHGVALQDPQGPAFTAPSVSQLERYIARLVRQYRSRAAASTSDLSSAATPGPASHKGPRHGSTQSLSAYESRSTSSMLPGGSITPCKSLLGNSARVSLSSIGKRASRNSINLGNLPSATGEDVNISLHLNFNLNLAPGANTSLDSADAASKNGSCGASRSDFHTASATSLSSATSTPGLRARSRISTCPSTLSHRSSLEVAPSFVSAPGSQRSSVIQEAGCGQPKLSEDSAVVEEISRLSGLSRAVVVGLMEQGVELDADCFRADPAADEERASGRAAPQQRVQSELTPQRPVQLSLSVTQSPQSQCSLTPPRSHSSSPLHPYQAAGPHHYQCNYQPPPPEAPSSTASSPASRPSRRGRSPPRPLQPSPLGSTPLSVFRRDAPFQCSLPRASPTPDAAGARPRGGSLRQGSSSGGWGGGRAEGEGLYRGKHVSRELVRAAAGGGGYAKRESYGAPWGTEDEEEERDEAFSVATATPKRTPRRLWRAWEGRLRSREPDREEADRAEYGYYSPRWRSSAGAGGGGGWRKDQQGAMQVTSTGGKDKRPKVEGSPSSCRRSGKGGWEKRSSSLRFSRRALFRSESQSLLEPRCQREECLRRQPHWVSSLDVGERGVPGAGARPLRGKEADKRLSSTASLFNLSRSQSLEDSWHSLSPPLSSPSLSPSPPSHAPLQRSRSLRDLGRRVFGSMRSLSLKKKPSSAKK